MQSWKRPQLLAALIWSCLVLHQQSAFAFSIRQVLPHGSSSSSCSANHCRHKETCHFLAKRRGKLGSIVDAGESIGKTPRTVPKKRSKRLNKKSTGSSTTSGKKTKDQATTISPLLQEWAASSGDTDGDDVESTSTSSGSSTVATSFEPFDNQTDTETSSSKKQKRAPKKSLKQAQDEERKAIVMNLVEQLEQVLDPSSASEETKKKTSTTDIQDILNPIRQLLQLPNANANLRQLIAGSTRHDYRLAWVGSDNAICHIGTGLHNVPLARLQEVFFSCVGKSRLEVLEVIRIIGPFPNVRNTLEGSCKIGKRNLLYGEDNNGGEKTVSELAITYDSMIDGTGKQITAGMEDNIRKLNIHIAFCDENAIVAVVPSDDGGVRQDPFEDNGANILFFAREEVLDDKLEALRVL